MAYVSDEALLELLEVCRAIADDERRHEKAPTTHDLVCAAIEELHLSRRQLDDLARMALARPAAGVE